MRTVKRWFAAVAVVAVMMTCGLASADPIGGVLVVDTDNDLAFVGWHGAFEFPTTDGQAWTLFLDVVGVGTGEVEPSNVDILLFTVDGTFNPDHAGNLDAGTIYNRLTGEGYNVSVANQVDILTMTDYTAYDLVIYPNLDDRSAATVVASGVPFITMEPGQTDEMNIGTGVSVFSGWAQTFYVVEDGSSLAFDNAVRTEAIEASGNGQVIVSLNAVPEPGTMMLVLGGFSGLAWLRRRKSA